jgi:hypothetical protein
MNKKERFIEKATAEVEGCAMDTSLSYAREPT